MNKCKILKKLCNNLTQCNGFQGIFHTLTGNLQFCTVLMSFNSLHLKGNDKRSNRICNASRSVCLIWSNKNKTMKCLSVFVLAFKCKVRSIVLFSHV